MAENVKRPIGVSILSVLNYLSAGMYGLLAILLLVGSSAGFLANVPLLSVLGGFALIGGFILLGIAVLLFFIARGLWKGQNWSRILTLVFSWIYGIGALLSIFGGNFMAITSVAINGLIIWYFQFKEETKSFFSS